MPCSGTDSDARCRRADACNCTASATNQPMARVWPSCFWRSNGMSWWLATLIRTAIRDFIAAHPIAAPAVGSGKLYETENARLLRRYFYEALDHGRAYYLYGAPGTQKTYVLQHLIAELNRSEIAKNGEGRRAYYIYVRQGIHSLDLM